MVISVENVMIRYVPFITINLKGILIIKVGVDLNLDRKAVTIFEGTRIALSRKVIIEWV